MAKKVKEEVSAVEPVAEVAQESVALTITDLQLLAQVVDLASTRGAFRAAELSQVGAVYTKLSSFLEQVAGAQKAAETVTEAASE